MKKSKSIIVVALISIIIFNYTNWIKNIVGLGEEVPNIYNESITTFQDPNPGHD